MKTIKVTTQILGTVTMRVEATTLGWTAYGENGYLIYHHSFKSEQDAIDGLVEKMEEHELSKQHDDRPRLICDIAKEIAADWKRLSPHAEPYLSAMKQLRVLADEYGDETADTIILYFLSNAGTWRGETAKRIKAELNEMIGKP